MAPYAGNGTRLDAYRATPCINTAAVPANGQNGDFRTASEKKDGVAHDIWWFEQLCYFNAVSNNANPYRTRVANYYRGWVEAATIGRAFFISQKGYLGLAPSGAQVGHRVYLLQGGQVPYILQETGETVALPGRGTVPVFKYIGDSYVHGIMNGEATVDVEGRASLERWALH
ncbi:hypothetical protein RB598_006165 [Gaeumannomyces tritici]